jgi:hypothetical protein
MRVLFQGSTINRWLSVIGIVLMVFGAYGFFVVKDKIKVLDKLVKESERMVSDCRSNLCSNVNNCCDTLLLAISAVPVCFDFRR